MIRFPLAAIAGLTALGRVVGCGSATPAGRAGGSGPAPRPSASTKPGAKATPTATTRPGVTSPVAAAEAGFKAWATATVLLTGGGPSGLPVSSMPKARQTSC